MKSPLTYEQKLSKKKAADERRRLKLKDRPVRLQKPRRATKKHKKQSGTAKLKKELDAVFSKYIRAKYQKYCYTCNKPSKALQCGHFISRQYLITRWDERNARPQCWVCNSKFMGNGRPLDFEENLKEEYGDVAINQMKESRNQIIKNSVPWYQEQIDYYTQVLAELS